MEESKTMEQEPVTQEEEIPRQKMFLRRQIRKKHRQNLRQQKRMPELIKKVSSVRRRRKKIKRMSRSQS